MPDSQQLKIIFWLDDLNVAARLLSRLPFLYVPVRQWSDGTPAVGGKSHP
jgi:hypothetical protein